MSIAVTLSRPTAIIDLVGCMRKAETFLTRARPKWWPLALWVGIGDGGHFGNQT